MSAWSPGQFSIPMKQQRVYETPKADHNTVDENFVFLRENFDCT